MARLHKAHLPNLRLWFFIVFVFAITSVGAQEIPAKDMPRLRGARLLVGYPPWIYAVTTGNLTLVLKPELGGGSVRYFLPTLSRDGRLVAGFRWQDENSDKTADVATYSTADERWTVYPQIANEGMVAISPDGARLAYIQQGVRKDQDSSVVVDRVHILDLATGRDTTGPESGPTPVSLSWSPDGKRLVYCHWGIEIWDVETNQRWKVVDGQMPAWSPDGQWIAYFDLLPPEYHIGWRECMVVHPDGTGARTLIKLPRGWFIFGGRLFLEPPIWSPDSRKLMLNEMANGEKWTMHIDLLDVTTGKMKRAMKNKVPVYAWAEPK